LDLPVIIESVAVLGWGLLLGSFSSVLIHRIPENGIWFSFQKGERRSSCVYCGKKLAAIDLVPVFSWLISKGQCRYCHHRISFLYPGVEVLCALACLGFYLSWGFTVNAFILMAGVPFLTALAVIDIRQMILPNVLNLITGFIALIFLIWNFYLSGMSGEGGYALVAHLAAGVLYPAVLLGLGILTKLILKKETIGGGDIKFFAVAGLFLGIGMLPIFMVFGGAAGVIIGMTLFFLKKKGIFPFGPALILSLYLCLIFQGLNLELLPMIIDPIYGISQY